MPRLCDADDGYNGLAPRGAVVIDAAGPDLVAALDLGSNSFHLIIARPVGGELQVVDRMREPVQLAAGFDAQNNLTAAAQETAIACLERFGERLRDIPRRRVRVVGTNTLRKARNALEVMGRLEKVLGHRVEIISGREEARLVYLGVARSLDADSRRRLVVDIGGGSTECILGRGLQPEHLESLHMGCVSYSLRFFPAGKLKMEAFKSATTAARVELEPIERRYRSLGWERAVGASGTVKAIDHILRANGWSEGITRDGLRRLRKELVAFKDVGLVSINGLTAERASVLPGGLAILYGVFKSLRVERMTASMGALREGLLYELVGSIEHEDVRDRTVQTLMERYHVDVEQAARVENTATACLDQVAGAWDLLEGEHRLYLGWAARLHELGLVVTYAGYQKHGGYLIANSDLPGFSRGAQTNLAALVRAHRRRLHPEDLAALRAGGDERGVRSAVLLRIAVALNRSRSPSPRPPLTVIAEGTALELHLDGEWLGEHPMTQEDLEQEKRYLAAAGFDLKVIPRNTSVDHG